MLITDFYTFFLEQGDYRVEGWPLMGSLVNMLLVHFMFLTLVVFMKKYATPLNSRQDKRIQRTKVLKVYHICSGLLQLWTTQKIVNAWR